MSATTTSPAWKRPGATWSPTLLAWNVTVSDALTATPATSPVDASTPEGRSTETTGNPQALIRSIIAAASGAGSAVEAGAEEGVDHDVAAFDGVGLDGLPARLAEHAGGDPPVAAVRAAAADDGEPARVRDTRASPRTRRRRPPAPSGRARSPGSRGTPPRRPASRPRCRAPRTPSRSRAQPSSRTTQAAPAIVWEWVSETSISRMPTRSA